MDADPDRAARLRFLWLSMGFDIVVIKIYSSVTCFNVSEYVWCGECVNIWATNKMVFCFRTVLTIVDMLTCGNSLSTFEK